MSDTIYLYLKTHNVTGLKYLGKTVKDPYTYKGSGIYWLRHIKKYGNDVTTQVLFETEDVEEFREVATKYSEKLNIVESKKFANMVIEDGGTTIGYKHTEITKEKLRRPKSKETKKKLSKAAVKRFESDDQRKMVSKQVRNRWQSEEYRQKFHSAMKKRGMNQEWKENISKAHKGKSHTEETKKKMSETRKGRTHREVTKEKMSKQALIKYPCEYCGKEMNKGNLTRHQKKCVLMNWKGE